MEYHDKKSILMLVPFFTQNQENVRVKTASINSKSNHGLPLKVAKTLTIGLPMDLW